MIFLWGRKVPQVKSETKCAKDGRTVRIKEKKEAHSRELEDRHIITEKISLVNNWIY